MNKFTKLISKGGDATLLQRVELLAKAVVLKQKALIANLEERKNNLEMEEQRLLDLAPETSDSLRPATKQFDAGEFVEKLQDLRIQLAEVNIELEIANKTWNDLFEEEKTPATA